MNEVWRPINMNGAPWPYEISSHGRIRRTVSAMGTRAGKILHPANNKHGYPTVFLYGNGDGTRETFYVHRLVASTFIGPCPDNYIVNHIDGDRGNPDVLNLEYITQSENNWRGGLSEKDALELRNELDRLMEQYGVGPSTLMTLAARTVWKWLA